MSLVEVEVSIIKPIECYDSEDDELHIVSPPMSSCPPVLDFMPKSLLPTLCDSNIAFDMSFPRRYDITLVAMCSKIIIHSHTSPIDIWLLPTNYHHIALVPCFVEFHAKSKIQIVGVLFRHV